MSGISSSVAQELYSTSSPTAPGHGVPEEHLRPAVPATAAVQSMETPQSVTDSTDYLTSPQVMVAAGSTVDTASSVADLASQYINQYAAAAVASNQPGGGKGEGGAVIPSGDSAAQDIH